MKLKRILASLLSVILVMSVPGAVFGSGPVISVDGINSGWVNKDGIFITVDDGGTKQPVDYKISTNVNDNFDNLANNIPSANESPIALEEGNNQYLFAKSGESEKVFGPMNVDTTDPAIVVSAELTNFSYIITEANLDYSNSGYEFSSTEQEPSVYSNKFTSLQGMLYNNASRKYLHVKVQDKAGNYITQTTTLNTASLAEFVNHASEGYVSVTLGDNVNAAKTTYYLKDQSKTYETKSISTKSSKIYFPSTGIFNVIVNAVLSDGRTATVTSDTFTVSSVDVTGPVIEIDSYRKGSTVTISDKESGVDTARSYIVTMGDTEYFRNNPQIDITYSSSTVELVKAVAYDIAGNSTTKVFLSKYLDEDAIVDISHEYRDFFLFAEGYTPTTSLKLDSDQLYYVYSGSKAITFTKEGKKDIKFYVDPDLAIPDLVDFDVFDSKEISWTIKNSQNWDLANSYYQRNGKGSHKVLKKSQYVDRVDFDSDYNFVSITLVDFQGNEVVAESRYFRTEYQSNPGNTGTTTTTSGTTPTTSTVTNTNNVGGGIRTDGLKYRTGYFQYITGYPDGNFGPTNPISRAEFVQILSAITEGGSPTTISYSDVNSSDWHHAAITRMAGLNVAFTNGDVFRPNDDITRGEAAAMLARLNLNSQIQQPLVFTDIESHPLKKDINDAAQKGLIYGYMDGTFKPDYRISRVEAVAIINRALGRASDQTSVLPAAKLPPDMKNTDWGYYDVVDAMNTHSVGSTRSTTGYIIWTGVN